MPQRRRVEEGGDYPHPFLSRGNRLIAAAAAVAESVGGQTDGLLPQTMTAIWNSDGEFRTLIAASEVNDKRFVEAEAPIWLYK